MQNQEIPGSYVGSIVIQYLVTENSFSPASDNGFSVTLVPPLYTNGFNATDDDFVSSYTYVQAFDYGDAPSSYGEAVHEINLVQSGGSYQNYIYLGSRVDQESSNQASDDGLGDENNDTDDEDGVVFPSLIPGNQVTIPVDVTVEDSGFGYLYGWIDWNRDGDFEDEGESIVPQYTYIFGTSTIDVVVDVPVSASVGQTFARFRAGAGNPTLSPSGFNAYGEVEDYMVTIASVLPMELTRLWGDYRNSHNFLAWESAQAVNSAVFTVERRFEGEATFCRITKVDADSHSAESTAYSFRDYNIERKGVYYYRLNQISEDGNSTFSKVVPIMVDHSTSNDLSLVPNPAKSQFTIHFDEFVPGKIEIRLWNTIGQLERMERVQLDDKFDESISINLSGIASGTYLVSVNNGGKVFYSKLIVNQ